VPGNGTFNLTALWRALGIKNPDPSMRESVQPVIIVADFSQLTPQHRPPTASYGATVNGVAGEQSFLQVTSRAPGGTLVQGPNHDTTGKTLHAIQAPIAGALALVPGALWSVAPMQSLVETGTDVGPIGNGNILPVINDNDAIQFGQAPTAWWLPPGRTWIVWVNTLAFGLSNITFTLVDLPASQPPEA